MKRVKARVRLGGWIAPIRNVGAIAVAILLAMAVVPLPACEHFNCSVDCNNNPRKCLTFEADTCPTSNGCHVQPGCVCATADCSKWNCIVLQTAEGCAQNSTCQWGKICEDDVVDCESIHDSDECERLEVCTADYDC